MNILKPEKKGSEVFEVANKYTNILDSNFNKKENELI